MNKNNSSSVKEMISKWHLERSLPAKTVFFCSPFWCRCRENGKGETLFLGSGYRRSRKRNPLQGPAQITRAEDGARLCASACHHSLHLHISVWPDKKMDSREKDSGVLETLAMCQFISSPSQVRFLYSFNKNVWIFIMCRHHLSHLSKKLILFFCLFHFILKQLYWGDGFTEVYLAKPFETDHTRNGAAWLVPLCGTYMELKQPSMHTCTCI